MLPEYEQGQGPGTIPSQEKEQGGSSTATWTCFLWWPKSKSVWSFINTRSQGSPAEHRSLIISTKNAKGVNNISIPRGFPFSNCLLMTHCILKGYTGVIEIIQDSCLYLCSPQSIPELLVCLCFSACNTREPGGRKCCKKWGCYLKSCRGRKNSPQTPSPQTHPSSDWQI